MSFATFRLAFGLPVKRPLQFPNSRCRFRQRGCFYPLRAITLFSVCLGRISTTAPPSLHPDFRGFLAVGSEEAHLAVLTSVRRSNRTCRFPASSFHNGEHLLGCKEGMRWIKFTSPISP